MCCLWGKRQGVVCLETPQTGVVGSARVLNGAAVSDFTEVTNLKPSALRKSTFLALYPTHNFQGFKQVLLQIPTLKCMSDAVRSITVSAGEQNCFGFGGGQLLFVCLFVGLVSFVVCLVLFGFFSVIWVPLPLFTLSAWNSSVKIRQIIISRGKGKKATKIQNYQKNIK